MLMLISHNSWLPMTCLLLWLCSYFHWLEGRGFIASAPCPAPSLWMCLWDCPFLSRLVVKLGKMSSGVEEGREPSASPRDEEPEPLLPNKLGDRLAHDIALESHDKRHMSYAWWKDIVWRGARTATWEPLTRAGTTQSLGFGLLCFPLAALHSQLSLRLSLLVT